MGKGPVAAILAAVLLVAVFAPAQAATDLSALLAEPPSPDWIVSQAGIDNLAGPFTAHSYGQWVDLVNGTPGTAESSLTQRGFRSGYARSWIAQTTRDELAERVFEFGSPAGALSWYATVKSSSLRTSDYQGDIPAASDIPNAFGIVLGYSNGQGRQWRVDFTKGNFVFVVHVDSYSTTENLGETAVGQARLEYDGAPSGTFTITGTGPFQQLWFLAAGGAVIGAVALITVATIVAIAMAGGRRSNPQFGAPPGAQVSPDGLHWWDGTTWRPTSGSGP